MPDSVLTKMPRLRKIIRRARTSITGAPGFTSSAEYWEERYRYGGNSGAGSYNRLAAFKANVLNEFVAANDIRSVIEFGSGDGAQLELAKYPDYTGVDVSDTVLDVTRLKFAA